MKLRRLILILLLIAIAALVWSWLGPWLAVDSCLDYGGRFDYGTQRCER